MYFKDEFVVSLRDDPILGTIKLCNHVFERASAGQDWTESDRTLLVEAYALIVEMTDAGILPLPIDRLALSGDVVADCVAINRLLHAIEGRLKTEATKLQFASLRAQYRATLGAGFAYEFSQGDMERVQSLVNQVRDLISATDRLDPKHKNRLLARLERLQAEIHKKVSDLDRFWGLVGDAGVVLGKLGKDAKPIVDRIGEIANIVWRTQSRAEELPSNTPPPPILEDKSGDSDTSA